jgi:ribosomal protein L37AE/L43A
MDPISIGAANEIGRRLVNAGIDQMSNCPHCHQPISIGRGRGAGWSCPSCGAEFDVLQRRRLGGR